MIGVGGSVLLAQRFITRQGFAPNIRRTIAPGSDQILTARRNQVLKLIAEGEATKQIALHLNVSVKKSKLIGNC
jgi:DNA-binding NarL/FixJ family response regulator